MIKYAVVGVVSGLVTTSGALQIMRLLIDTGPGCTVLLDQNLTPRFFAVVLGYTALATFVGVATESMLRLLPSSHRQR